MTLDKTDLLILRTLQGDARLTIKELASRVGLTTTPTFERMKRLERSGVIKQFTTILDEEKLNLGFKVFCNVKLRRINADIAKDFVERIKEMPEVTECYNVSGNFDYMMKIHVPDMKTYQQFIINKLGAVESVAHIESTFVMNEEKMMYGIQV